MSFPKSIRSRLTLWYTSVLLLGLLLFSVSLWIEVRRYLISNLDQRLAERIQSIQSLLAQEEPSGSGGVQEELTEYARTIPEGSLLRVRNEKGRELIPGAARIPAGPSGHYFTAELNGAPYRFFSSTLRFSGRPYEVTSGASEREMNAFLAHFQFLLTAAIPFLTMLACGGGFWLSGRALAPVDRLTQAARRISVENLSERLPVPSTQDELHRLGDTWNEMLDRLQRAVERIKQFTADASHDLRTPVAIIRTTAELALRRERAPSEYRTALLNIQQQAEHMTEITGSLLLLARLDAQDSSCHRELTDLHEIARAAATQASPLAEVQGIHLRQSLLTNPAPILCDPAAVRRLLLILLENAVHHTPQGGQIVLETAEVGREQIRVSVRDSGRGIEARDLPHVFERFYRGDPARTGQNGAGLGLSIAQAIAHAHDVAVDVQSSPGAGACFSVVFPLSANFHSAPSI